MIEKCPFSVNLSSEAMPWDKLHCASGTFSYYHGDVDGIGGRRPLGQTPADRDGGDNQFGTEAGEMIREAKWMVELADRSMRLAVATVRENGATWEQIGGWLHITKQAAQQRYGRAKKS